MRKLALRALPACACGPGPQARDKQTAPCSVPLSHIQLWERARVRVLVGFKHNPTDVFGFNFCALMVSSDTQTTATRGTGRKADATAQKPGSHGSALLGAYFRPSRLRKKGIPRPAPSLSSLPVGREVKESSHLLYRVRNRYIRPGLQESFFPHPAGALAQNPPPLPAFTIRGVKNPVP